MAADPFCGNLLGLVENLPPAGYVLLICKSISIYSLNLLISIISLLKTAYFSINNL
jgi:hypothetical protein